MAAETHTFTPQKLFAGASPEVVTIPCTVKAAANLAAYTVVEYDAAGKIITSGGTNKPAGILVSGVTNAADAPGQLYKAGNFFASELVWHATQATALLQNKLVDGTMIVLGHQDTGES